MIAVSRIGVFAVLFAFLTAVAAWAQDETGPNYTEWRSVAVAVDQGLANPDISNADLQLLRGWPVLRDRQEPTHCGEASDAGTQEGR